MKQQQYFYFSAADYLEMFTTFNAKFQTHFLQKNIMNDAMII